jgi:alpha-methylacyl-CoA racemase
VGPLNGVKIIEMAGIGPGPFAAMLLADMGANVLRLQRPGGNGLFGDLKVDVVGRGRVSLPIDLRDEDARHRVLELATRADVLIEGFRPGVMERLGLGPDVLLGANPRLVYGRMTGWGQEGPLAPTAGHDINYISLTGALDAVGRQGERPGIPLNLVGDYGGGGMLLALGVVAALWESRESGQGQVVDAAMVDGASTLMSVFHGLRASGIWGDERGTNILDSGAPFYEVYETADGGHFAVGAIEPQFYAELLRILGIEASELPQWDRRRWPEFKTRLAEVFASRTRDAWAEAFAGTEACATPVLSLSEAPTHPHSMARHAFVELDGVPVPAPSPRFSRTSSELAGVSRDPAAALEAWGLGPVASER